MLDAFTKNKTLYSIIFIFTTLLGIAFSYQYLTQIFFASDWWSYYNEILRYGPFHNILSVGIVGLLTGGTRTLGFLSHDLFMYFFGLSMLPLLTTFFVLHIANVFMLFKILKKLKISPFSSFLASFFFAIASAGEEFYPGPLLGCRDWDLRYSCLSQYI